MRGRHCLICCKKLDAGRDGKQDAEKESGQLVVLFVLRRMLNLSTETCQRLTSANGQPSSWDLVYCPKCWKLVRESYLMWEEIKRMSRELDVKSMKLREELSVSFGRKELTKKRTPNRRRRQIVDVADEIRQAFSERKESYV
jgi:hypothetical protein